MNPAELSPDQRRERGTRLCARLAADVASITPKGIGTWDRAWAMVAPADADFMIALSAWEIDPTPETLERTRTAYRAVLDAWRSAVAEWTWRTKAER